MSSRTAVGLLAMAALAFVAGGCARDLDTLGLAPFPSEPAVFVDGFGPGVGFAAFAGSKTDAVQIDQTVFYTGRSSLRVSVPAPSDPSGSYAGGAFTANVPRNLSGYNAVTLYARASRSATLNVAGLGNDNTGTSLYTAEVQGLPLTTSWTKIVIPIPLPERLQQEAGLFYFAEGAEDGQPYTIWFDEIQFEKVGGIGTPRPAIDSEEVAAEVGGVAQVQGFRVAYTVNGASLQINPSAAYFTFTSSDESVATVNDQGLINVVGEGTATITASLGSVQAEGSVVVKTAVPPATPAPTPMVDASKVISLFSDAYTNVAVDTWSAVWDNADVEDFPIDGNASKKYSNLVFAGIEFVSAPVDASMMTHFHMDFYTPDPTAAPAAFRIKLVDFGADRAFGGGDDSEHEITLTASSTPALATGEWVGIDIPLSEFAGLAGRGALAQLILSGDPNTVYIDNVYFYNAASAPTEPPTAAPTPALPAGNVISLFSDAYSNAAVDTWSASWDNADVADVQIQSNLTKKYSNLVFAGIEAVSSPVDARSMTHFHVDLWTPDETSGGAVFRIKLVDFGANGAFGGGDDVEHEITLTASTTPALATGSWIGMDIPLSDFTALTTRGAIAQLIISGDLRTVYIDNVYFHN